MNRTQIFHRVEFNVAHLVAAYIDSHGPAPAAVFVLVSAVTIRVEYRRTGEEKNGEEYELLGRLVAGAGSAVTRGHRVMVFDPEENADEDGEPLFDVYICTGPPF